ncbi:sigma factor [Paenibacillus elgii]
MEITKLAAKAKAGDSDAFVSLVRLLENSMYYMAKSILRNDEDVADAMQETILKAFKALPSLREPKYFKTWVLRILINECHNCIASHSGNVVNDEIAAVASLSDEYEKVDLRDCGSFG